MYNIVESVIEYIDILNIATYLIRSFVIRFTIHPNMLTNITYVIRFRKYITNVYINNITKMLTYKLYICELFIKFTTVSLLNEVIPICPNNSP